MGDYGEIVGAVARIMQAVDHQDREMYRDSWTEDVDFEVVFFGQAPLRVQGRDRMVEQFTASWTGAPSDLRHQLGAIEVQWRGSDEALARFYCTYVRVGNAGTLAGMGEYEDQLAKGGDGRWRVRRRRHVFLTPLSK